MLLGPCFPAPGSTHPSTPKASNTFAAQPSSPLPDLGTSGGKKTSLLPPSRTRCLLLNLPSACRSRLLSVLLPAAVSGARLICFSSILQTHWQPLIYSWHREDLGFTSSPDPGMLCRFLSECSPRASSILAAGRGG